MNKKIVLHSTRHIDLSLEDFDYKKNKSTFQIEEDYQTLCYLSVNVLSGDVIYKLASSIDNIHSQIEFMDKIRKIANEVKQNMEKEKGWEG